MRGKYQHAYCVRADQDIEEQEALGSILPGSRAPVARRTSGGVRSRQRGWDERTQALRHGEDVRASAPTGQIGLSMLL